MCCAAGVWAWIGGHGDETVAPNTTQAIPGAEHRSLLRMLSRTEAPPTSTPGPPELVSEPASDVPPAVVDAPETPGPLGSVESVICSVAWECGIALRVAACESGSDYSADFNSSGHAGTFQISPIHAWRFSAHGWDFWNDGTVLERNVVIAYEIYKERWWYAWSCF